MTSLAIPEVVDTAEGAVPFLEQMEKNKSHLADITNHVQQTDFEIARAVSVVFNNMNRLTERMHTVMHYSDSDNDDFWRLVREDEPPEPPSTQKVLDEAAEHFFKPLTAAYHRLQPRMYRRIASLHILWDTKEDIELFEPGRLALKDVFTRYGYETRYEKLPVQSPDDFTNRASLRLEEIIDDYKDLDADDLLIIHYRGDSYMTWKAETRTKRALYLRPSTSASPLTWTTPPMNLGFRNNVADSANWQGAQAVHLLDSDYPVDHLGNDISLSNISRHCCDAVLARSSSLHDWKDSGRYGRVPLPNPTDLTRRCNNFYDCLIQELQVALDKGQYHTLSSLYSAIQAMNPGVFAT